MKKLLIMLTLITISCFGMEISQGAAAAPAGVAPMEKSKVIKEAAEAFRIKNVDFDDINAPYEYGTLLHYSVRVGKFELTEQLIDNGADVNAKNVGGYTPLHVAACRGYKQLTQLLISRGAQVRACNIFGDMPLTMYATKKNDPMRLLLIRAGADFEALPTGLL